MKYWWSFFIFLLIFFCYQIPVQAHFIKTDGTITTEIHIDPNDDPIAGEKSFIGIEVNDRSGKFSPSSCTCTIVISNRSIDVLKTSFFTVNKLTNETELPFIFPKDTTYTVTLSGKPIQPNVFQPFQTQYEVHVEHPLPLLQHILRSTHFVPTILVIIAFIITFLISLYNNYKQPKSTNV